MIPDITTKPLHQSVLGFRGAYYFLSSFYLYPVTYENYTYASNEHAFHAAKSLDPGVRMWIASAPTSSEAKRRGRSVDMSDPGWAEEWDSYRRYSVMADLITLKFHPVTRLSGLLISTHKWTLVEQNTWHDNTWGICVCGRCTTGHNILGWMLMRHRDSLIKNAEVVIP